MGGCSLVLPWDGYADGPAPGDASGGADADLDADAATEAAGPISCNATARCIPPLTAACSPECSVCHVEPIGMPICVCHGGTWTCTDDKACKSDGGWYDIRTGDPASSRPDCSFLGG
jgi:hypothetical protein